MQEHAAGHRFESFAASSGIETPRRAYDVQREFVDRQASAGKTSRAGYKIGLTSPSMQAMCGIDTPIAGVVLRDRVHASHFRLDRADHVRAGIEFEIAVRIGHDLPPIDRPFALAEVQSAVDAVAPAIEIIDDRHCDYASLDVLSLIADNAWNAGVVLGTFCSSWPELAEVTGTVVLGDAGVLDQGRGRDVLGHPLLPVLWLANHLAAEGIGLRRGEVVMTGSLVTTKFPTGPGAYRFEVSGLGSVALTVAA
jgi:2-keto-4-pentenoate hydratase